MVFAKVDGDLKFFKIYCTPSSIKLATNSISPPPLNTSLVLYQLPTTSSLPFFTPLISTSLFSSFHLHSLFHFFFVFIATMNSTPNPAIKTKKQCINEFKKVLIKPFLCLPDEISSREIEGHGV